MPLGCASLRVNAPRSWGLSRRPGAHVRTPLWRAHGAMGAMASQLRQPPRSPNQVASQLASLLWSAKRQLWFCLPVTLLSLIVTISSGRPCRSASAKSLALLNAQVPPRKKSICSRCLRGPGGWCNPSSCRQSFPITIPYLCSPLVATRRPQSALHNPCSCCDQAAVRSRCGRQHNLGTSSSK